MALRAALVFGPLPHPDAERRKMSRRRLATVLYVAFLVGYSFMKYGAAAPPSFSGPYARSTAILVFLTGVVPFVGTIGVQSMLRDRAMWIVAVASVVLATVLCVLGYAAYWSLFLADVPGVPGVVNVAMRGVPWGLAMGLIATLYASEPQTE